MKEKLESPKHIQEFPMTERKKTNMARKLLLEGVIALGLAGFFAGGQKSEAQSVNSGQKVEMKEQAQQDILRVNDLAKETAQAVETFELSEEKTGKEKDELKAKADRLLEIAEKKYGSRAVDFIMHNAILEDEDKRKEVETQIQFINGILLNPNLEKELIENSQQPLRERGYTTAQIEIDGKKMDALITYSHVPAEENDGFPAHVAQAEERAFENAEAIQKALEVETESKGSLGKYRDSTDMQLGNFFIRGDETHPGWYDVHAVGKFEK